ncbi:MAG: hypothetical protein ACTSQP_03225 [Promethearchaeota archaeon]
MSKDSQEIETKEIEYITRFYNCPKCKTTHSIKIPKNCSENRNRFPFPYAFLHSSQGNLQDLLTIIYLDKQLQIRGVDVIEIKDSEGIFSEELTKAIIEKLMDTIVNLQEENTRLQEIISNIELDQFSGIEIEEDVDIEDSEDYTPLTLDNIVDVEEEIELEEEFVDSEEEQYKSTIFTLRTKTPGNIKFKTPAMMEEYGGKKIVVYIVSTIGPGEKKEKLTINTNNFVEDLKETIGKIYGLIPANFHLSSGGVTFDENSRLFEYDLDNGDEILIIPSSVAG